MEVSWRVDPDSGRVGPVPGTHPAGVLTRRADWRKFRIFTKVSIYWKKHCFAYRKCKVYFTLCSVYLTLYMFYAIIMYIAVYYALKYIQLSPGICIPRYISRPSTSTGMSCSIAFWICSGDSSAC